MSVSKGIETVDKADTSPIPAQNAVITTVRRIPDQVYDHKRA